MPALGRRLTQAMRFVPIPAMASGAIIVAAVAAALAAWPAGAGAQMVTGAKMTDFAATFGLGGKADCSAKLAESSIPGDILFPNEQPAFTIRVTNSTDAPLKARGRIDIIQYGTKGKPGDIWVPTVFKIADTATAPISADLPGGGSQDVRISPRIPLALGAYALVSDFGGARTFLHTFVRTFEPPPQKVPYPKFCLDNIGPDVLKRLGVHAVRYGVGYKPTTDRDYESWYQTEVQRLRALQEADIAVLLMAGGGAFNHPCQPMGLPRPWLDDAGRMLDTKFDLAWLPAWDADFKKWIKRFCVELGWPKGPVNAVSLWNEPWEGISISGWGADMPRYREIYMAMAEAAVEARAEAKVEVLVGGCDSTSNALDKLFGDGSDKFMKYFDFCSIHYQGLDPRSTIKAWVDRKGPYGRVRIWDTESWVANTDDRVAAVIAADRAAGYDRAMGVYGGNIRGREGAWPVAAAVGAATHFIGERDFVEILFKNGLPWVFVFDGLPGAGGRNNPEDGTIVVVGDLGATFGADHVPLRTARIQPGAAMTVDSPDGSFSLYDFYGNPVPARSGRIAVPLDSRGFFLRAGGRAGSFAGLVKAVKEATLTGVGPIAPVCRDMIAPIGQGATLRLSLTNVTNRPVTGRLEVKLGGLTVEPASQTVAIGGNETKTVVLKVSGTPAASNTYPLEMLFDGGAAVGAVRYKEDMHVNVIARRTIKVDGDLADWEGVPPQPVTAGDAAPTLTEAAWFPFKKFDASVGSGFATGYLAYDDLYFYFAAKVADSGADPGMPRFESLGADEFFYPDKCIDRQGKEHVWPEGVRRFSYRKDPELPAGNAPAHDNVQIAFNVLPPEEKPWYPCPPGTMPGFIVAKCTDYEYALNPVAARYGGGTEIWRMEAPGMPHKHFYPRQPASPKDGPVKGGKLAMMRDAGMRIVECAIPWSELPDVKKRLDAGEPIKFSFRVNDNKGAGCMELSRGRSVAKRGASFHCDWVEHWSNEVEFGFER